MEIGTQSRRRTREQEFSPAVGMHQKPSSWRLVARLAIGLAAATCATPSSAEAPAKDLWQSYIDAAAAAEETPDFETEAIVLARALPFAKQHDAQGQKPTLTRLLLMLAYLELGREDLWQPLANETLHIDVSNLDPRLKDSIKTIDKFGWNYYDRWKAHSNDKSEDDFKQSARLYGAENSFRMEIAFRQKLMPDDQYGLGSAEASLGLVYFKQGKYSESNQEYSKAITLFESAQRRHAAMTTLSTYFSVGDKPGLASAEQGVPGDHVSALLLAAAGLVVSAADSLQRKDDDSFAAQVAHVSVLYTQVLALTNEVSKSWSHHPVFAQVQWGLARLYQTEFKMTRMHPDRYPDSFSKAKDAFENTLSLLEYSQGPNSPDVRDAASDYIDLLTAANQPDEAKNIEQRYGIKAQGN